MQNSRHFVTKILKKSPKLKDFYKKIKDFCQKLKDFWQKLNGPELLSPVMFQSDVQKKA